MSLKDCRIIQLPKITDDRGSLTFIEGGEHVPFEIKRVFYLHDFSAAESRGGHAHKTCHQFLVSLSGCCNVRLDDGIVTAIMHLGDPSEGLYVPPMIWVNVSTPDLCAVCLVLCSDRYDEADYIRDYKEFLDECQLRDPLLELRSDNP